MTILVGFREKFMEVVSKKDLAKLSHRYQVMFAVFCAEQVIHLVDPKCKEICLKAIGAAKGWIRGEATAEECRAAAYDAAYDAATAAAYDARAAANAAANAAAYDARAAAYAARAAAYAKKDKKKIVKQQWDYYSELLNLDENLEKILVG